MRMLVNSKTCHVTAIITGNMFTQDYSTNKTSKFDDTVTDEFAALFTEKHHC